MSPSKFFYIILRSGRIYEYPFTHDRFRAAMGAFQNKGVFAIEGFGAAINGADFVEVLDDQNYKDYLSSVQPKEYVVNGAWFNKRGDFVRYSTWRQLQIDEQKKLQASPKSSEEVKPVTQEQRDRNDKWLKENMPQVYEKMQSWRKDKGLPNNEKQS